MKKENRNILEMLAAVNSSDDIDKCDCQYKSDPVASIILIHFASVKVSQSPA